MYFKIFNTIHLRILIQVSKWKTSFILNYQEYFLYKARVCSQLLKYLSKNNALDEPSKHLMLSEIRQT